MLPLPDSHEGVTRLKRMPRFVDVRCTGVRSATEFQLLFPSGSCSSSSPRAPGVSTQSQWRFCITGPSKNSAHAFRSCKKFGKPTAKILKTLIWMNSTIPGQNKVRVGNWFQWGRMVKGVFCSPFKSMSGGDCNPYSSMPIGKNPPGGPSELAELRQRYDSLRDSIVSAGTPLSRVQHVAPKQATHLDRLIDQKGRESLATGHQESMIVHDESGEILVIHFIHPETKGLSGDQKDTRECVEKNDETCHTRNKHTGNVQRDNQIHLQHDCICSFRLFCL